MWIVRLALKRPYTFVVMALLILVIGSWFSVRTSKDVFPSIDIPVVSVIWSYQGLPADEFADRITTLSEYTLSSTVNDIEHIESQTIDGAGVIRLYFHPGVEIQAAVAQASASCQSILKEMPLGVQPPVILRYSANTVPLIQIVLSSQILTEQELYDYGIYRIRQFIATVQGATLPAPYGGKARQILIDCDPVALQASGLSPRDIDLVMQNQNTFTPTGDVKIGSIDYRINLNNTVELIDSMNEFPVAMIDGDMMLLKDVAHAHDGYAPQTNIVRADGLRAVLLTVLKNGAASTLDIINSMKFILSNIQKAAPPGLDISLLFDQSIFVRASIENVAKEGALAAFLTGLMIFMFLGSIRSTFIVWVSIPLSILASIIFLSLTNETLNLMTLGGLALAIGILVDDATVAIENIHRNLDMRKSLLQAVLDGSFQVTIPAFVSTLVICIVFLPVTLLTGPAQFLFVPFAKAVVIAILTSYFLSRTLLPVMTAYLLKNEPHQGWQLFERGFIRFRSAYERALRWSLEHRKTVLGAFVLIFASSLLVISSIGEELFPTIDAGQMRLHVRVPSGTRVEVTEDIFGLIEAEIKKIIPPRDLGELIDNIGLPFTPYNLAFGDMATIAVYDGQILISLSNKRKHSTAYYMKKLRQQLPKKFPDCTFYFQPADMVNQILNFGAPCPIDVCVMGYNHDQNLDVAYELIDRISRIPGTADVHLQQVVDEPELYLEADRKRLALVGLTQRDLSNDVLTQYGTTQAVTPNFWLDRKTGIPYQVAVQTPKYRTNDIAQLLRTPVMSSMTEQSQLLGDLATLERKSIQGVVSHYNIQPLFDVFANVQGRDLGSVASDVQKVVDEMQPQMAPGNSIVVHGLVTNMQTAFTRLGLGLIFAIILIYSIMVINFQSWLDPFIIIMALPGALTGIVWILFLTHSTFNVPSLMGAIMSIGVATANSILLVTFANRFLKDMKDSVEAIVHAATTRLRPVLMTAFAMIVGMIPIALAIGEGSEQNAPLGRAVIGGLLFATVTTLFFVPIIFTYLRKSPNLYIAAEEEIDSHERK